MILDRSHLTVPPHNGNWAAWLGGDDDEVAYIQQEMTRTSRPSLPGLLVLDPFCLNCTMQGKADRPVRRDTASSHNFT
ncbi:MAG: hypothetical protein ACUVSF_04160 [Anaerolineae bacterium]